MLLDSHALLIVVVALVLDALIGDPDWLWKRLAHPVVLIGTMIGWLDRTLNRDDWSERIKKIAGIVAALFLIAVAGLVGLLLEAPLRQLPGGWIIAAVLAATLIAQRSLYDHVAQVRDAFATGGLTEAREKVSLIVGRDPQTLDEAGVCRAAIESSAENFSDGVVAPVFWLALLGLPGLLIYKTINTADSMIGHLTPLHRSFGWAAARLDDVLNLVPARLSGLLIALAAPIVRGSVKTAITVMRRDAGKHRSPNAGWPESAMAAAIGVALAGPRSYSGKITDDPYLNAEARSEATPADIGRALRVMIAACALQAAIYAALALVL
ncbi:adenosylcobinamide-phosphate synthase [Rhodopseudomonas thermotolerans]|uniref:Cobalamin biosynthesis protein CobD n=2 Tax=Rhodopseudomonas TaxID=1073 RepID=A0A336JM21_9BRAD|nr:MULTISPECIES: adenosylcobinamide-phosphate synthase CbiB [Rhodopseudomonas]RED38410.1 adenosylcobinamide-phosphate synthase [Rhodopseudomonas pentothenatexigens]REG05995.1 adenosylcobinamide-phosphate synthase [Rhodopseudomonas thermotolerans]SSW89863.1 adenosylcobinamide-phosphate synthase [Rhodopseudomonas pentothenatexigens]